MGIYISLVIASFLFIYNILYIFLSFLKTYYYILLDIVPYIVVMKLFVNKGIRTIMIECKELKYVLLYKVYW